MGPKNKNNKTEIRNDEMEEVQTENVIKKKGRVHKKATKRDDESATQDKSSKENEKTSEKHSETENIDEDAAVEIETVAGQTVTKKAKNIVDKNAKDKLNKKRFR